MISRLFLRIIIKLTNLKILRLSDKTYLKVSYKYRLNGKLDLNNPKTFNEKLQWLKLYDRKEIYTKMVDKYEAKEYVASIIGNEYIIPTVGIFNTFDEINFDTLPTRFVIKCTHDSGGLTVVTDKKSINVKEMRKIINKHLHRNFYYLNREWPYKNVKPRIIIEKYMEDSEAKELRDYKFFCFNGKVEFFKIDFDRFIEHRANYYDTDGKLLHFGETICPPNYNKKIEMPVNLNKMIELAQKLSANIPFLRVDFYEVNGKIYFGELTFFPAAGFGRFTDDSADLKLGNMLDISQVKKSEK